MSISGILWNTIPKIRTQCLILIVITQDTSYSTETRIPAESYEKSSGINTRNATEKPMTDFSPM